MFSVLVHIYFSLVCEPCLLFLSRVRVSPVDKCSCTDYESSDSMKFSETRLTSNHARTFSSEDDVNTYNFNSVVPLSVSLALISIYICADIHTYIYPYKYSCGKKQVCLFYYCCSCRSFTFYSIFYLMLLFFFFLFGPEHFSMLSRCSVFVSP